MCRTERIGQRAEQIGRVGEGLRIAAALRGEHEHMPLCGLVHHLAEAAQQRRVGFSGQVQEIAAVVGYTHQLVVVVAVVAEPGSVEPRFVEGANEGAFLEIRRAVVGRCAVEEHRHRHAADGTLGIDRIESDSERVFVFQRLPFSERLTSITTVAPETGAPESAAAFPFTTTSSSWTSSSFSDDSSTSKVGFLYSSTLKG